MKAVWTIVFVLSIIVGFLFFIDIFAANTALALVVIPYIIAKSFEKMDNRYPRPTSSS